MPSLSAWWEGDIMLEFCTCGSIKNNGSCSNKKCTNHIKGTGLATFKQVEYIKDLQEQLNDDTGYDFNNMTEKDASKLIEELEERLEVE